MWEREQENQSHFFNEPLIEAPAYNDILCNHDKEQRLECNLANNIQQLENPKNHEDQMLFNLSQGNQFLLYFHRCKAKKSVLSQSKRHLNSQAESKIRREKIHYEDRSNSETMLYDDKNYFKELKRLFLKERLSTCQYINDIREVLSTRILSGQQRDECIQADQLFAEEQRMLNKIKKDCQMYTKSFEEFLSNDHDKSMKTLNEALEIEKQTVEMTNEKNQLSSVYGQLRLEVYFWEEAWRMVKQCQKFLYQVSPMSWREEHDWIHRDPFSHSHSGQARTFSSTQYIDESSSILSLIDMFEEDVSKAKPPELFFDNPLDLNSVFKTIELQNLNALIHLESLVGPMSDMATTIDETEHKIKSEINEISEEIKDLEYSIKAAEDCAADLERNANSLLHGVFCSLVCSEDILYLRVFIEDAYESCVALNDANLEAFTMMQSIERAYEDISIELDNLPHRMVVACEKDGFRDEIKLLNEAEDAMKKFDLMYRLLSALKRVMEEPKPKQRQLMKRSEVKQQKSQTKTALRLPTKTEQQFLKFFTTNYSPYDHTAFRDKFLEELHFLLKNKQCDDKTQSNDNKETNKCLFFN